MPQNQLALSRTQTAASGATARTAPRQAKKTAKRRPNSAQSSDSKALYRAVRDISAYSSLAPRAEKSVLEKDLRLVRSEIRSAQTTNLAAAPTTAKKQSKSAVRAYHALTSLQICRRQLDENMSALRRAQGERDLFRHKCEQLQEQLHRNRTFFSPARKTDNLSIYNNIYESRDRIQALERQIRERDAETELLHEENEALRAQLQSHAAEAARKLVDGTAALKREAEELRTRLALEQALNSRFKGLDFDALTEAKSQLHETQVENEEIRRDLTKIATISQQMGLELRSRQESESAQAYRHYELCEQLKRTEQRCYQLAAESYQNAVYIERCHGEIARLRAQLDYASAAEQKALTEHDALESVSGDAENVCRSVFAQIAYSAQELANGQATQFCVFFDSKAQQLAQKIQAIENTLFLLQQSSGGPATPAEGSGDAELLEIMENRIAELEFHAQRAEADAAAFEAQNDQLRGWLDEAQREIDGLRASASDVQRISAPGSDE